MNYLSIAYLIEHFVSIYLTLVRINGLSIIILILKLRKLRHRVK